MPKTNLDPIAGRLLLAAAALPLATVAILYTGALSTIAGDGVANAVPDATDSPDAAYWYLVAGGLLLIGAPLIQRLERRADPALGTIGWLIIALGVVGALCKPVAPFWVFLVIGAIALRRARRPAGRRPVVGLLVGGIAVIHIATVVVFYGAGFEYIVDNGVLGAASREDTVPDAAFWYAFSGLGAAILGLLLCRVETHDRRILAPVAWSIIGLGAAAAVVQPGGGAWILLPVGLVAIRSARQSPGPTDPDLQSSQSSRASTAESG